MFCVCERGRLTCTFFSYFLVGDNIKSLLQSEWWAPLLFILHSGVFTRKILRWGPRWNVVDQTAVPWDVSEPSHTRVWSVNVTFVNFCWLGVQHLQHGSQAGRCNGAFSFALLAAPETKKPSCTDLRFHHQFNRAELSRAEPEVDALWSGAKARCVAIRSTPRADRECFCSFWLKHCLHRLYLTVLLCSCSAVSSDVLSYR